MWKLRIELFGGLLLLALLVSGACAQEAQTKQIKVENRVGGHYTLTLEPLEFEKFDGLHSFAAGSHDGKWFLFGGRTDGLHRMRPFEAFLARDNNINIVVMDPKTRVSWSAGTDSLPASIREQLESTNMQFYQDGDVLYLVGGYGYSKTAKDHITYDTLIEVKLAGLANAVKEGKALDGFFRQVSDPMFAVTGGQMERSATCSIWSAGRCSAADITRWGPITVRGSFRNTAIRSGNFVLTATLGT